ncbi:minor capsid protein [Metabacillus sp. HB246100]
MDIIEQISRFIANNVELNAKITSPILAKDPSSIAIRETPSSVANRYLSTDKTLAFQFQILVKDSSVITVRKVLNSIFEVLDGLNGKPIISGDESFIFSSCECTTLPNYVETTDHGEVIYTAIFNALIEKGGNQHVI